MNLIYVKVFVLILLIIIKSAAGLCPLLLNKILGVKKGKYLDRFMNGILCIGGGVLMATVFVHMIPEVREGFDRAKNDGYFQGDFHYPLAEVVVCLGFFAIYGIEAFVHKIFGFSSSGHGHTHGIPPNNNLENGHDNPTFNDEVDCQRRNNNGIQFRITSDNVNHDNGSVFGTRSNNKFKPNLNSNVYNVSSATLTSYTSYSADGDSMEGTSLPQHLNPTVKNKMGAAKEQRIKNTIRNFFIVFALSIHSVFEGMAIGKYNEIILLILYLLKKSINRNIFRKK